MMTSDEVEEMLRSAAEPSPSTAAPPQQKLPPPLDKPPPPLSHAPAAQNGKGVASFDLFEGDTNPTLDLFDDEVFGGGVHEHVPEEPTHEPRSVPCPWPGEQLSDWIVGGKLTPSARTLIELVVARFGESGGLSHRGLNELNRAMGADDDLDDEDLQSLLAFNGEHRRSSVLSLQGYMTYAANHFTTDLEEAKADFRSLGLHAK